ncbi:unnamed protein product [Boreogadus saida]
MGSDQDGAARERDIRPRRDLTPAWPAAVLRLRVETPALAQRAAVRGLRRSNQQTDGWLRPGPNPAPSIAPGKPHGELSQVFVERQSGQPPGPRPSTRVYKDHVPVPRSTKTMFPYPGLLVPRPCPSTRVYQYHVPVPRSTKTMSQYPGLPRPRPSTPVYQDHVPVPRSTKTTSQYPGLSRPRPSTPVYQEHVPVLLVYQDTVPNLLVYKEHVDLVGRVVIVLVDHNRDMVL